MNLTKYYNSQPIVYKGMGFEVQPGAPILRRDNFVLCVISLIKHMLTVSNMYSFKKYIWSTMKFVEFWHIKPLNSQTGLHHHDEHLAQMLAFPTHHLRTSYRSGCLEGVSCVCVNGGIEVV